MVTKCLLVFVVAGCYAPSPPNGALLCSTGGKCPESYHCAVDRTCWRTGEDPDPFTQPPILISPRNGASTGTVNAALPRRPLFRWRAVAEATSYEVQVDDSCDPASFRACDFSTAEADEMGNSPSLRLSAGLAVSSTAPAGRRYYWRVRGCGSGRCTPWSEVRYLDVGRNTTDFTGDGGSDLVIGNAGATVNGLARAGAAYIAIGVRSGLPSLRTLTAPDAAADDNYGIASAFAGDVDADGFADLAVAASVADQSGRVYFYRGGESAPSDTPSQILQNPEGQTVAFFGSALAGGDLDGDGRSDLAVAAERQDDTASAEGKVFIYAGQSSSAGLLTTPSWILANPAHQVNGHFGTSLAIGDFDGDGYADLAVGAGGQDLVGRIFLYRGGPNGVVSPPAATLDSPVAVTRAEFGHALAAADFDGDGYADLAVSAATEAIGGRTAVGRVYLFHGGPDGIADRSEPWRTLDNPTGEAATFYGFAIAAADFNADDTDDLAVTTPYQNAGMGRIYVYQGAPDGLPSVPSSTVTDPAPANGNDFFGWVLATGDHAPANGFTDLFVGALRDNGVVYLFDGATGGLSTTTGNPITGTTVPGSSLGLSSLSSSSAR